MFRATSYTEVLDTLKKPCGKRSPEELDSIVPWIQSCSKAFSAINEDVMKVILEQGVLLTVPKRVAVIIQGEIGDSFYMILKGSVSVSVHTAVENERIFFPPDMNITSLDSRINQGVYETEPFAANFNRSLFGNVFAEMSGGKFFGELALMSKESIRKASVITEDMSDILVIKRDVYQRCLLKQQRAELKLKRDFIKTFPAFSEWNDRQITNLALSLRLYKLKTGKNIVNQGELFDGLQFIIKGQARVTVKPSLHPKHFDKYLRQKQTQRGKKVCLFTPRKRSEFASASDEVKEEKDSLQQAMDSISKYCRLTLFSFDAIGIIGDIEFLLGWNYYFSTVICTEDCHILHLDKGDCTNIFLTRGKRKMTYFLRLARDKVDVLLKRWPEPTPVRLLSVAQRELNKLLTPVQEPRNETGRRKQFTADNAPPSMFPVLSMTSNMSKDKTEKAQEDKSDSDLSLDPDFMKRYRYSIAINKEKTKEKKKKKEVMFGRAKGASKANIAATKGMKKLLKRESEIMNESQQKELAVLTYRIMTWYDDMEEELGIPADKCVPKLYKGDIYEVGDVCRLLDEK